MLKDTKSLGNNKAPACESRGFVLKKEGVLFDTPSFSDFSVISGSDKAVPSLSDIHSATADNSACSDRKSLH